MVTISLDPPLEQHEYCGFKCYYQTHRASVERFPVVVFLGGLLQDVRAWFRCARYLNRFTTVIAIDPPGIGYSPVLPSEYDFDFIADSVRSVLDAKGLDRVALGGASYGGLIAYRFAQLYPERLSTLVLGGTFTQLLDSWRAQAVGHLEKVRNNRLDDVASEFVTTLACQDADVHILRRKLVRRVLTSTLARMSEGEVQQYCANIERVLVQKAIASLEPPKVRSLLFTGQHDTFTTPQHMRGLASGFDEAVFTTILDADHLSILERFETVIELIHRFFASESLMGVHGSSHPEYFGRKHQRDQIRAAA
jgi:pimeloyl-ACP methyl ester carboxylesterase